MPQAGQGLWKQFINTNPSQGKVVTVVQNLKKSIQTNDIASIQQQLKAEIEIATLSAEDDWSMESVLDTPQVSAVEMAKLMASLTDNPDFVTEADLEETEMFDVTGAGAGAGAGAYTAPPTPVTNTAVKVAVPTPTVMAIPTAVEEWSLSITRAQDARAAFVHAVHAGDYKGVRRYIKHSGIKNVADLVIDEEHGFTALMVAASKSSESHDKIFSKLLKQCNAYNAVNTAGETALIVASRAGNTHAVKKLLTIDAVNVSAQDGTENNDTALTIAVAKEQHEVVKVLAKNPKVDLNQTIDGHETALMQAAHNGDITSVKYLVKYGVARVNLNVVDTLGKTALMMAVCAANSAGSHHDVIEYLLKQATINTSHLSREGKDVLTYAMDTINPYVVQDVLNSGKVSVTDEHMRHLDEMRMHTTLRQQIHDLLKPEEAELDDLALFSDAESDGISASVVKLAGEDTSATTIHWDDDSLLDLV